MSELQLSMLQKDMLDLEDYIKELKSKGKHNLVLKLSKKLSFLKAKISDNL
jgi:hypothetical protein